MVSKVSWELKGEENVQTFVPDIDYMQKVTLVAKDEQ